MRKIRIENTQLDLVLRPEKEDIRIRIMFLSQGKSMNDILLKDCFSVKFSLFSE